MRRAALNRLRRTAFHEAGHAVARFYLMSFRTKRATIKPTRDGKALGHVAGARGLGRAVEWSAAPVVVERLHRAAVVCMAGAKAERRAFPRDPRSRINAGGADDFRTAVDLLSRISEDNRYIEARLRLIDIELDELMATRWRDAVAVVEALLRRETLTGDEIREVINAAVMRAAEPVRARREAKRGRA